MRPRWGVAILVFALCSSRAGLAGFTVPDIDEFRAQTGPRLHGLRVVSLQTRNLTWTGGSGESRRRLPVTVDLASAPFRLRAPSGDWSELTLELEGPARFEGLSPEGERVLFELELGSLTLTLDEPAAGGERYRLELELGALELGDEPARALRDALEARALALEP